MTLQTLMQTNMLLADIEWRPGYGPRWIWLITAAHLIAAWCCFSTANQQRALNDSRESNFWYFLGLFMAGLGVIKILDLQALLTVSLRNVAKTNGWYSDRQTLQTRLLGVVGIASVLGILGSLFLLRGRWLQRGVAYFGALFLLTLIIGRSISYTRLDTILYGLPGIGNRMNAGLELAGAVVVGLGAWCARGKNSPTRG